MNQPGEGPCSACAGGDPGGIAGTIVDGVDAILVGYRAGAGSPPQGRVGGLVGGTVGWDSFIECAR